MIDPLVLQSYGAKEISLQKDEVLFREGEEALNYFQVIRGSIKMITNSPDGQEFIQGVFKTHDSFGEPPLLCSFPYPSNAIALEDNVIDRDLVAIRPGFALRFRRQCSRSIRTCRAEFGRIVIRRRNDVTIPFGWSRQNFRRGFSVIRNGTAKGLP